MPSVSGRENRFMRLVVALKSGGKVKNLSLKLKKAASGMSMPDAKDFAGHVAKKRKHIADAMTY